VLKFKRKFRRLKVKVTDQIARPYKTSKSMITLRLQMLTHTVSFYLVCFIGKEVETGGHTISA